MPDTPDHVWVFGGDHSPWVQSVLLGLHEKKIAHTVTTVPPLSVFAKSGILMPAAQSDAGPWQLDSARILEQFGFRQVDEADQRALQRIFGAGALQRTVNPSDFWHKWSELRDGHASLGRRLFNHLLRPFSVFYFFTIISVARLARSRRPQITGAKLAADFSYWEQRLDGGAPFLGGDAPDTVDLQLFGQVQMFASIPCPSLRVIQEAPDLDHLRAWTERMQARFSDYDHLYSGPFFQPKLAPPKTTSQLERTFFWIGCVLVWIAFPLALAATLFFTVRISRKNLR